MKPVVATGDLDRYLALPRPVLLHVLTSRSSVPSMGDFVFGLIWFVLAGDVTAAHALRFLLVVALSACTFTVSLVLANSLVFWLRRSELLGRSFPERHDHLLALSRNAVRRRLMLRRNCLP